MPVDRPAACHAFNAVCQALQKLQTAVKNRAPVDQVSSLLRTEFKTAVEDAKSAGIFTDYLEKAAGHLYSPHAESYRMQVRPSSLGWTIKVVGDVSPAELQRGKEALKALLAQEIQAFKHLSEGLLDADEETLHTDEGNLLTKLQELTAAGVDGTFIEGQIELVGTLLKREPPAPLPQYPYAAMADDKGNWFLEQL